MISLYTFYFVLIEIRYRKKPREAIKASSEDKAKQAKAKKCDKKKIKLNREKCSKKTHITWPRCHWKIDSVKFLHFKHFRLPYTLFEACGAVFITHSKINLRKISLNEYFNTILHYFGVNLLSGLTAAISSLLGLRFSWEPNARQIPTDLLTSLSREIIIRSLFYLLADLVLASHADVLRGVVFPPSHKLLLTQVQHSFPIVLLSW